MPHFAHTHTFRLFGTDWTVSTPSPLAPGTEYLIFASLLEVMLRWSPHYPASDIARINVSEGEWTEVHPLTVDLIMRSNIWFEQSGGAACLVQPATRIEVEKTRIRIPHGSSIPENGLLAAWMIEDALHRLKSIGMIAVTIHAVTGFTGPGRSVEVEIGTTRLIAHDALTAYAMAAAISDQREDPSNVPFACAVGSRANQQWVARTMRPPAEVSATMCS